MRKAVSLVLAATVAPLLLCALPAGAQPAAAGPSADGTAAETIEASAIVPDGGVNYRVEFIRFGDDAGLRIIDPANPVLPPMIHINPVTAAALLADRRAAFLWQPLLQWAGPNLEHARTKYLAAARSRFEAGALLWAPQTTAQTVARRRPAAVLQYADALLSAGQGSEAMALLEREYQAYGPRLGGGRRLDRSLLRLRLATYLHNRGDTDGALRLIGEEREVLAGTAGAANLDANAAAYLAESGRYQDALAAVDAAEAAYLRGGSRRIPGSERQFAWIRACALHGLGRTAEAEAALGTIMAAESYPRRRGVMVEPSPRLLLRARMCMQDREAQVAAALEELSGGFLGPWILVRMQPGYALPPRERARVDALRADSRVAAALAERMRVLPPELMPPQNW